MFSFHKPKIYRSNNGCCICRAKSSSSRFTDSSKYEQEFEKCFQIREKRCGEICNACVLLVKRWKKLPDGTNRHWNHVVDARAGPGTKSTLKMKNKLSPTMQKYKSPLKSKQRSSTGPSSLPSQTFSIPSPLPDELSGYDDSLDKSDMFSQASDESEESDLEPSTTHNTRPETHYQISPFLDLTYWKMTQVCCGMIFKGMNGEVLLDPTLLKPCWSCKKTKSDSKSKRPRLLKTDLSRSTSMEDTDSNSSAPSFNGKDFYEIDTPDPETPPDSPAESLKEDSDPEHMTLIDSPNLKFVSDHSISLEF
ncbi:SIN3-HDAC complex-associated factor-like [Dreissena polymorpha]|uniref:Protein FAM60A n=1 Tax=Dreissena polymorpha TaxID=45954 RepID=A0A9D4N6M3_DREPO|nr:SIN3-HDAC complex-associated factor-like [Dreissena polymorpha]KAH3888981.1 hypothetical protein DPMN_013026 [Dreissena polymorpha]